jgi:hypothetical protein
LPRSIRRVSTLRNRSLLSQVDPDFATAAKSSASDSESAMGSFLETLNNLPPLHMFSERSSYGSALESNQNHHNRNMSNSSSKAGQHVVEATTNIETLFSQLEQLKDVYQQLSPKRIQLSSADQLP